MTKEIGALDTETLDILLGLLKKALMHQLLKPRHMLENLQISTNCPTVQPSNHPDVQTSRKSIVPVCDYVPPN